MKVNIVASGSNGNCVHLQSAGTGILIDAGKWKRDIEKKLLEHGVNAATDIQAIFVTHAHGDHIRGLTLAKKYHIPVYATDGEWKKIGGVPTELQRTLETTHSKYDPVDIGILQIHPFRVHHDALEPVAYAIEDDDENRACVVFDTGHIDDEMLNMMDGNIFIVEANHDIDMLKDGPYDDYLKDRIASPHVGHLSNDQTAEALAKLMRGTGEQIYLTHLSTTNNLPALAAGTVKAMLGRMGFREGRHYTLEVIEK